MVIRQRAIQDEDKQERQQAILDAAERLLGRAPDRIANVAEVAIEAGLAKGTVYLYFPGKEELLLALHERNIDAFFRAVISSLESDGEIGIDDMLAHTRRHMIERPLFLPLAARCFGMMAHGVPREAALAFKERMATRLQRAGAGLERRFPELAPGDGVALFRRSYALILGLWQMSASTGEGAPPCAPDASSPVFAWRYADELDQALRALWQGTLRTAGASSAQLIADEHAGVLRTG